MDLDAVLAGCSSNDNAVRKQAEQAITAAAKSPEILSQLMQRLQSAEQPQVLITSSTQRHIPTLRNGKHTWATNVMVACMHAL